MSEVRIAKWTGRARTAHAAVDGVRSAAVLLAGTLAPMLAVMAFFNVMEGSWQWAVAAVVGLAFVALLPWLSVALLKKLRGGADMRTFVADDREVAVLVTILLACGATPDYPLGRDEGVLCHEEGWLVFRGHRSEWAIDRVSATAVGRTAFRFRPPGGPERIVRLECLGRERALAEVVREWQSAPPPTGAVVLPPTVVVPEGRRLVSWPVALGLLALLAIPAGLATIDSSLWTTASLLALALTIFASTTALYRRRTLRMSGAWEPPFVASESPKPVGKNRIM